MNDNVTLASAVTLTTTNSGAVDFAGTVNGAQNLTLAAAGATVFNSTVGNSAPIGTGTGAAIVIDSTGTTTFKNTVAGASGISQSNSAGNLTFEQNVTLGNGDTATNLAGAVTLDGLDWSSFDGITFGAATLSTAAVSLDSNGGNIALTTLAGGSQDLTIAAGTAAGTTTVTGNVSALGDGTGAALTVNNSATGLVDFQGTFGANSGLTGGAGTSLKFGQNVTLADGDTVTNLAGAVTLDGLDWSSFDGITFGAATLSTAAVSLDSNGGNIALTTLAGGSQDLTIAAGTAAGTTTVTGNVSALGDGTGAALTVDNAATGLVDFQGTFGANSGLTAWSGHFLEVRSERDLGRRRHGYESCRGRDLGRLGLEQFRRDHLRSDDLVYCSGERGLQRWSDSNRGDSRR